MNQKYLQGLSTNMDGPEDAVFFEATPENIAAFLSQHQTAQMAAIGTIGNRSFLTTRMGFIDICPDQVFLREKLLPIYAKVQMGELPVPPLRTVPRELALTESCPKPDWNYLRWDGYSDRKYQGIQSGEALLNFDLSGEKAVLEVQVRSYYNNGGLAVLLADWSGGAPEPWGDLTVNLGYPVEKDCAFVDVNHLGESVLAWIEKNALGKPMGRSQRSGFVTYPECRFNAERLQALDDNGYFEYSRRYDSMHKPQKPQEPVGAEDT